MSTAPSWDAIAHDVCCPLCDYNLRGLSDPRCPECGHRFDWAVVTDPAKRLHPYLFEHHPERNVRSFFRTLVGTLRPRRFWDGLPASQPIRPGRMVVYWLLTCAIAALPVLAEWARATKECWDNGIVGGYFWGNMPRRYSGPESIWPEVWETAKFAWGYDRSITFAIWRLAFWVAWPLLTLLSLQIFRASMRRAKVKTVHVVRCLVYTFDVLAWLGLLLTGWTLLAIWIPAAVPTRGESVGTLLLTLAPVVVLIVIRLTAAYKRYMRFDHACSTVVASQVIALLLALNVALLWENWVTRWIW